MKGKTLKRSISRSSSSGRRRRGASGSKNIMEGSSLARHLTVQLGHVSLFPLHQQNPSSFSSDPSSSSSFSSCVYNKPLIEDQRHDQQLQQHISSSSVSLGLDAEDVVEDKDCILSQDFFCTPDYITPDGQQISNSLDCNKENIQCPKSPEKLTTVGKKRYRADGLTAISHEQVVELASDIFGSPVIEKPIVAVTEKKQNYVSQSAVALRCRVMPPPCIKNPYLGESVEIDVDPFGNQRSKSTAAGFLPNIASGEGLSRYRTDFHEIEQIGYGNFSRVFKVLKRVDGCMYAVKHSIKKLLLDNDRRQALMEVQALAAIGSHRNIVGYYTSWFENDQLYIQMELCDRSLSIHRFSRAWTEGEVLEVMYQIGKALQFIHEQGIAHLDVKPENIYVKKGIYKLGDFGCATRIDGTLSVEEGDARYMPQEILNDKYDHLNKVDIFSLGAAIYELVRRSPLPESGSQFLNLREGKIPLLPGHSLQFQNLLKAMVDPDPVRRPSATELVENAIFDKFRRT